MAGPVPHRLLKLASPCHEARGDPHAWRFFSQGAGPQCFYMQIKCAQRLRRAVSLYVQYSYGPNAIIVYLDPWRLRRISSFFKLNVYFRLFPCTLQLLDWSSPEVMGLQFIICHVHEAAAFAWEVQCKFAMQISLFQRMDSPKSFAV